MKNKIVGPGYNEIVARYQGQTDAESRLVAKVKAGGQALGFDADAAEWPYQG